MRERNELSHIVIFVEGDTDKVFFDKLVEYYRKHSKTKVNSCEVRNLKGVSRYSSKVLGKLKNEILPAARKKGMIVKAVCCSYDTDVFEFSERPVVNWNKVRKEVKAIHINEFYQIRVKQMIEDWLLDDISGLCRYLKLKKMPAALQGKDGYQKIQSLFRHANKIYLKGNSVKNFIDELDLSVIRNKRETELVKTRKSAEC